MALGKTCIQNQVYKILKKNGKANRDCILTKSKQNVNPEIVEIVDQWSYLSCWKGAVGGDKWLLEI